MDADTIGCWLPIESYTSVRFSLKLMEARYQCELWTCGASVVKELSSTHIWMDTGTNFVNTSTQGTRSGVW